MKKARKWLALFMVFVMVLGMSIPAMATDTRGEYISLSSVEAIKAGETATVNVVVNKDMNMNAFQFDIELNSDKVEIASENYDFYTAEFSEIYTDGLKVSNYTDEIGICLTGANAKDTAFVKAGTIIASFVLKAKEDLAVGDIVATEKTKFITDDVNQEYLDQNTTTDCVVVEKEDSGNNGQNKSEYISLSGIKALKAGETATVNVVVNKDVNMNAFTLYIKPDLGKVQLVADNYKFFTSDFKVDYAVDGIVTSNYTEEKGIILAGANADDTAFVKAGTIIASFTLKAMTDLTVGDVVATERTDSLFDDVNQIDLDQNTTTDCVVVEKADSGESGDDEDNEDNTGDDTLTKGYISLSSIEALKAGETATVNVVVNKDVNMNAFTLYIKPDLGKVQLVADNYKFFTSEFSASYSGGSKVSNYTEEDGIILVGANAKDTAFVKTGTVIASFTLKAITDLEAGDVVATERTNYITDSVNNAKLDENVTADCVVVEKADSGDNKDDEDNTGDEGNGDIGDNDKDDSDKNDKEIFVIDSGTLVEYNGSASSVTIPDGVHYIGESVFANHTELEEVIIPESVYGIKDKAFYNCPKMKSITLKGFVWSVGEKSLGYYENEDGEAETIEDFVIYDGYGSYYTLKEYASKNNLTYVDLTKKDILSLSNISPLKAGETTVINVVVDKEVSMSAWRFSIKFDTEKVEPVLDKDAEGSYSSLYTAIFKDINARCSYKDGTLVATGYVQDYYANYVSSDTLLLSVKIKAKTDLQEEDTVAVMTTDYVGHSLYSAGDTSTCKAVTEETTDDGLVIENGVVKKYQGNASKVTIPEGVEKIKFFAFEGCKAVTEIVLPESLTRIEGNAFENCENLLEIHIPESVTYIGEDAFTGTKWLAEKQKENPLVVVNNILVEGRCAEGKVVIPEGVTEISSYAFYDCDEITEVRIPGTVKNIGDWTFAECDNLKSVVMETGVARIGDYTFRESTSVSKMEIPETVTAIGYDVFCTVADDFVVYGYAGSYAEMISDEFGVPFILKPYVFVLEEDNLVTGEEFAEMVKKNKKQPVEIQTVEGSSMIFEAGTIEELGEKEIYDFTVDLSLEFKDVSGNEVTGNNLISGVKIKGLENIPESMKIKLFLSEELIGERLYYYEILADGSLDFIEHAVVNEDGAIILEQNKALKAVLLNESLYNLGDVNEDGVINANDALLVLKYVVQKTEVSGNQKGAADVNTDGIINARDALEILKYVAGINRNEKKENW